jgi:hypothetical protein
LVPGRTAVSVPVTLGLDAMHATNTLSPRGVAAADSARAIGDVVTTKVRCAVLPAASTTTTVPWQAPACV